jgi:glycolate oxidase iron-sulfur subunit
MPKMKLLLALLRQLEDALVVCMRCGLCQAVCPLYAQTGREADVARGKLALLDGLIREMIQDPQGVYARLDRCLLCGSCAANCPSGVRVLDIFLKARAILTGYLGLSPVKKAIFRKLLVQPELFNRLLSWGARLQGLFIKPVDDLLGSSCARFLSPLLRSGRHVKPLAQVPLHCLTPSLDRPSRDGQPRVAFFVGCLIDKIFPQVGEAVLKILEHHGVGVFMPQDQGCCGIPALSAGDLNTFNRLVRHSLAQFAAQPWDYLVTACATCTVTIKQLWPTMVQDASGEERTRINALADRTLDINQFLVEQVGLTPVELTEKVAEKLLVTYHDPCHLKKSLGVAHPPRALLQANPRYLLTEMTEADWCCGCGGSFNLQHYEVSAGIGRRKRDNVVHTGCDTVATACPACMLQLIDMLSQAGAGVRVQHTVEIYAESL